MINAPFTHCAGCCNYYNGICNSIEKCPYQSDKSVEKFPNWEKVFGKPMQEKAVNKDFEKAFWNTRQYIRDLFQDYHQKRDECKNEYNKCKEENFKFVLMNDWHRSDAIMFILEKVGDYMDSIEVD